MHQGLAERVEEGRQGVVDGHQQGQVQLAERGVQREASQGMIEMNHAS